MKKLITTTISIVSILLVNVMPGVAFGDMYYNNNSYYPYNNQWSYYQYQGMPYYHHYNYNNYYYNYYQPLNVTCSATNTSYNGYGQPIT